MTGKRHTGRISSKVDQVHWASDKHGVFMKWEAGDDIEVMDLKSKRLIQRIPVTVNACGSRRLATRWVLCRMTEYLDEIEA